MFKKILIANRGEIAVRVMRACDELGIPTVAVYSEADSKSLHVRNAGEAVCIGPPAPAESYLNADKIIAAAKETGADAIHPGYGFLSENWEFAKRCRKEGIVFIGPGWEAMKLLGNKLSARELLTKSEIPVTPGFTIDTGSLKNVEKQAKELGFPVLVKAAAGGGGKGMRIVRNNSGIKEAVEGAMREAKSAFGDESVYVEKFIEKPRHIEFQILADDHGNVVYLNERECSIQRRHQKILEEAPSPMMTPELRKKMGETAVKVARSAGYTNAGTVEFLVDKDHNFYFLEVNTRLQVEHPVTEMTTGIDLVHKQIAIAAGNALEIKQKDVRITGHAIEVRLYAEDPEQGFLPSAGKIVYTDEPAGPGIRVDSGIYSGCDVPVFYDPILSKLIVWAKDRKTAIGRMKHALKNYPILGVKNTGGFLLTLQDNPEFQKGNLTTDFLDREAKYFENWTNDKSGLDMALAAASLFKPKAKSLNGTAVQVAGSQDAWQYIGKWEIGSFIG